MVSKKDTRTPMQRINSAAESNGWKVGFTGFNKDTREANTVFNKKCWSVLVAHTQKGVVIEAELEKNDEGQATTCTASTLIGWLEKGR